MLEARDAHKIRRIIDLAAREAKAFGPRLLNDMMIVVTRPVLTDALLQFLSCFRLVSRPHDIGVMRGLDRRIHGLVMNAPDRVRR